MVTTVAFGMGVNIPDVDIDVHWGAPRSFLDYWQEVGRAGRSGNATIALLVPYKRSTIKAMCDEDFASSLKSQQCVRRRTLLALLTKEMDSAHACSFQQPLHVTACARCVGVAAVNVAVFATQFASGKRGQIDMFL